MFKLPIQDNKHPNFEWRGQGRGADSLVLWRYNEYKKVEYNVSTILLPIVATYVVCMNNGNVEIRIAGSLLPAIERAE